MARGIYHKTPAGKHDMVLHQDHRGAWRIDLVTSAGGNHLDVTGPNRGYGSAEEAFQAALDVQRTRGIRGKSHVYIADRDGNLSDYEPMEANARGRGARRAVGCICGAKFANPHTVACIAHNNPPQFKAGDRVVRDDGSARGEVAIVGNYDEVIGGYRYKVQQDDGARIYWNESSTRAEGGHEPNGRATTVDPVAARELDLYIANTFELVGKAGSIGKNIDANLKRKLASGTYDSALAPKAWQYLVDQGAKRYEREFGDSSPVFNAATRRYVANEFARAWEYENKSLLDDHDVLVAEPYPSGAEFGMRTDDLEPNARQIPEHMRRYRDFSNDELYEELISKGYTQAQARLHAKRGSHSVGKLDFLPPRVPAGWTVSPIPIFRKRDAKVAFEASKGAKYMVFDQSGRPLSPELRAIRGLIEWRDANGWVGAG